MTHEAPRVVLRFRDLKPRKGIDFSRPHLARLEAAGRFPRRIRLSENSVAWYENEIDAWLGAKAATRVEDSKAASERAASRKPERLAREAEAASEGNRAARADAS
jgi:prophage regulatory protein